MKKKYFYLFIFLYLFSINYTLLAQQGFSKTDLYGYQSADFTNAILDKDKIVAFGDAYQDSTWGIWFSIFDTLGNIEVNKWYQIPNIWFANENNESILKTKDGNYLLVGDALQSGGGIVAKINPNGNLLFLKEYVTNKDTFSGGLYKRLVETPDGYFIAGTLSYKPNKSNKPFITKIDKTGKELWTKYYASNGTRSYLGSLLQLTDSTYTLAIHEVIPNTGYDNVKTKILTIDTSGQVIASLTQNITKKFGIRGLQKLSDGWLYAGSEVQTINTQQGTFMYLVRTDEQMQVQWTKKVGLFDTVNMFYDIKPTADGNWVFLAKRGFHSYVYKGTEPYPYKGALVHKFNSQGDSIWQRVDTAYWHPIRLGNSTYTGIVPLPSGNLIAVGYANDGVSKPVNTRAWMSKITKDGCIYELCSTISTNEIENNTILSVFPNPASDYTTFTFQGSKAQAALLSVYDINGRLVLQQTIQDSYTWQTEGKPSGIYFYNVFLLNSNETVCGKVILNK